MCTLYALLAKRKKLRELAAVDMDMLDDEEDVERGAVYPDQKAPVIRKRGRGDRKGRELRAMRWGFPPPPGVKNLVLNVRNTRSPFWEPWLQTEYRCVVPFTSFCEWQTVGKYKRQVWFRGREQGEVLFFAGIWREWQGLRGGEEGSHGVYSILTTEPNALVQPIHPKAMPVILRSSQAVQAWLEAPLEEALHLQRPAPEDTLVIAENSEPEQESPEILMPWG